MTYSFHIYECWPRVQMLSSTVPAHRMRQMLPIGFTFWDAGLHPDERSSALKYRACAQRVSDVTHSFYTLGCWPTQDEGSSALKYATCAQNVSDVTYSLYTLGCWPTPDEGSSALKYAACAQNVSGVTTVFSFWDADLHQDEGSSTLSTVPAHRMCQTLLIVFTFMDAALHTDKGSSALKYRACAQNVSDTTHIFYTLESCPTPRYGDKCSQVPCLRTECVRRYYSFFILGCWPTPR